MCASWGDIAERSCSSGPRASGSLRSMSEPEARGPEDDERLSNQVVFLPRLIEQLDHAAETAGGQAGESIDGPVWRAVRSCARGARARRGAAVELLVACGEAVDARLQVGLDLISRRALLDRHRWRAKRG